jgi:crotonobetainyl-CoA:carnitine CoA-transferase CaiB-like acyl-CoA transferase
VLDVTHVMAGAWCGCLLGQMGADVVKVERPGGGEDLRRSQTRTGGAFRVFDAVNHGKRSIAIDLREPRGAALVRRLARDADVFVENFRPGSLARHGLGADALCAENPGLVYCSISAFGGSGPHRDRAGFDLIAQGMAGILSLTGEPAGEPAAAGVPIADLNAGTFAALGILSAWIHRLRTGRGQRVEASLFESALAYTIWETALWFGLGQVAAANGSAHRLAAPYRAFRSGDGWITIAVGTQAIWTRLCAALGRDDLACDARFADPIARLRHRAALEADLAQGFAKEPSAHWIARLEAAGVPCGPVQRIDEVWRDPQALARGMLVEADAPDGSKRRAIGPAAKLSETPWRTQPIAPALGEHSREVLRAAGLADAEIEVLLADGIVEAAP